MTNLEICDYLLSIPNVDYFLLSNIGNSDIWADRENNLKKHTPFLGVRYALPVAYTTGNNMTGTRYASVTEIKPELQEEIINFIYPLIVPVEDMDIIDIHKGLADDNLRHFLSYRISYKEISQIRRKFQIEEVLLKL